MIARGLSERVLGFVALKCGRFRSNISKRNEKLKYKCRVILNAIAMLLGQVIGIR